MRLGDGKDLGRRAGLDELGQDLAVTMMVILDPAMELTVREGTGAAFAELDVGIGVEDRASPEAPGVLGALANHLATLEDDRAEAHLREDQSSEQATRAGADDERPQGQTGGGAHWEAVGRVWCPGDVAIAGKAAQNQGHVLHLDVERISQHDRGFLACVPGSAEDAVADEFVGVDLEPFENG